jgi:hypothetical protein
VEVVGPAYAKRTADVYIDDSVLDAWDVEEREEIERHSRVSGERSAAGERGASAP